MKRKLENKREKSKHFGMFLSSVFGCLLVCLVSNLGILVASNALVFRFPATGLLRVRGAGGALKGPAAQGPVWEARPASRGRSPAAQSEPASLGSQAFGGFPAVVAELGSGLGGLCPKDPWWSCWGAGLPRHGDDSSWRASWSLLRKIFLHSLWFSREIMEKRCQAFLKGQNVDRCT